MLTLQAENREIFGKKLKLAREAGKLPVVVYGGKKPPAHLFVSTRDFKKALLRAGESTMLELQSPDGQRAVLIHEVSVHPVSGEPVHADFLLIDKSKALKVKVPLRFAGTAPAVRELGGILVKVMRELEIEALPTDLPQAVAVDISPLVALESQLYVSDLKLPPGVKAISGEKEIVAAISVAKEEAEVAAPVDLSQIEVVPKGKKPEDETAATEGGAATAPPKAGPAA